ncbi:hypothetical protein M0R04_14700 [Candidatus Dojkabacteria bacterium]|jgi:hypothetical protein|nr:hypothetical protein [Candidatus Dojkabacteria bacterium]
MKNIEIPKFCLGKCEEEEYKCCRCGTRLFIHYQEGDGKRFHSLCNSCYNKLKGRLEEAK